MGREVRLFKSEERKSTRHSLEVGIKWFDDDAEAGALELG